MQDVDQLPAGMGPSSCLCWCHLAYLMYSEPSYRLPAADQRQISDERARWVQEHQPADVQSMKQRKNNKICDFYIKVL